MKTVTITEFIDTLKEGSTFYAERRTHYFCLKFVVLSVNTKHIIAKSSHFDNQHTTSLNETYFFSKKNGKDTTGQFVITAINEGTN